MMERVKRMIEIQDDKRLDQGFRLEVVACIWAIQRARELYVRERDDPGFLIITASLSLFLSLIFTPSSCRKGGP